MKKNVFLVLLVILLVFVFIGCGGNDEPEIYIVTIGALTNGSITANPTSGIAGTEIFLTVNPNDLYKLKMGTLKYGTTVINETTMKFILPSSNVNIIAEFESWFNGTWAAGSIPWIYIIHENSFIAKETNGDYIEIGSWNIETPNNLTYIITHFAATSGITHINEMTIIENPYIDNYTFEILSDSSFKFIENDSTFIQQFN